MWLPQRWQHVLVSWIASTPISTGSSNSEGLCGRGDSGGADWVAAADFFWASIRERSVPDDLARQLEALGERATECTVGASAAASLRVIYQARSGASDELRYSDPLELSIPMVELVSSEFPVFGIMQWLAEVFPDVAPFTGCQDKASREFYELVSYHLDDGSAVPILQAMEYIGKVSITETCITGQASALLAIALTLAMEADDGQVTLSSDFRDSVNRADELLFQHRSVNRASLYPTWPVWTLLHRLELAIARRYQPPTLSGCLLMVYAFPTGEIRRDTELALKALQEHYFDYLGVTYPLIVFTDQATSLSLEHEFAKFTSARIVPAVIPQSEIARPMASYSCMDGVHCAAGDKLDSVEAHRGKVDGAQYWSPDYLRISRYSAGPLFQHSALDTCSIFLKVDTDFFFTKPLERDPIEEMRNEASMLGYWQIHVQGQRQTGYMESTLDFLNEHEIPIRNKAFYARGRFEEKAERLGIDVSDVPEALEAATVIYGCLFGGDVRFFREPLYQRFFKHMDAQKGFEKNGWSNQFFLGTAAASFVFPSQVRRLYISGVHQESNISVGGGNVTEFLLGSSKSVLR